MQTRTRFIAAAIVCAAGAVVAAQGAQPAGQPYVEFRVINAGATTGATAGSDVKKGEPATALFTAGQSLCQTTFGSGERAASADARTVVKLSAALLDEKGGAYTLRLSSQHLASSSQPGDAAPFEQTSTMRDGDRIVLDLLRDATPPPGCPASVTLEARFIVKPEPALAQALFATDVWFVHRDETGHETSQHLTMNVNSTTETPFMFNDLTFPLPKLDPGQDDFTAFIRLSGTIKARARTDGSIDVDLNTSRRVGSLPDADPTGFLASKGVGGSRKTLTVRDDTAVAIELPVPGGLEMRALHAGEKMSVSGSIGAGAAGGASFRAGAAAGASGGVDQANMPKVFLSNGSFVFNMTAFFKGHVTQLIIKLHRTKTP